jgi:hypothetical protein
VSPLSGQELLKEATFDPSGKANIANLAEMTVDQENKQIILFFLTKSTGKKVKGEVAYFDYDFNFIKSENIEEEIDKVKTKYKIKLSLFGSDCNENSEPLLTVEPNWATGQVVFKKGQIIWYTNLNTGYCDNKFKIEDRVRPKGEAGEKIKLVNFWSKNDMLEYRRLKSYSQAHFGYTEYGQNLSANARKLIDGNNGDVVIMGMLSEKNRPDAETGKHYVIQKFSAESIELLQETKLDFPVVAVPIMKKPLLSGNMAYVFHRADQKYEYLEVDYSTNVTTRTTFDAPDEYAWLIDDIVEVDDDIYIQGLSTKYKITEKSIVGLAMYVQGINFSAYASKPTGYQIMKLNNNKIEWVSRTNMDEFKASYKTIAGEKKGKPYTSGNLKIQGFHVASNGNLLVAGQKYDTKKGYGDIVSLVFNNQGKLIANYATAKRDKNDYNEFSPTEHNFFDSPSNNGVYWTVYEVAGAKKRGETSRILYYPRISRMSNDGLAMGEFLEAGDRDYFLDDNFPVHHLEDNVYFYFGSDKKGKNLWFYKLKFE